MRCFIIINKEVAKVKNIHEYYTMDIDVTNPDSLHGIPFRTIILADYVFYYLDGRTIYLKNRSFGQYQYTGCEITELALKCNYISTGKGKNCDLT